MFAVATTSPSCTGSGFFSQKLEKAQATYSAFDRELLACVSGIRHFRFMFKIRPFRIYMNHKPLTFALIR